MKLKNSVSGTARGDVRGRGWFGSQFVKAVCLAALLGSTPSGWSAPPGIANIELLPRITLTGTPGDLFRIEYLDALSNNNNQWTVLKSLVLPTSPFLFLDTEAAGKAQRFYRITTDVRAPQLVHINPGQFLMGSPVTENDRFPDEGPQTRVTISTEFWMGKYEITQAEYMSVMGVNPSAFPEDLNRPVESVSWDDAVSYCARLTSMERAAGRLSLNQAYRLPTEAEWEYVARAGTTTRFSYGDDPGFALLGQYGWFGAISDEITHPVGTKLPNPWGLNDMHANVWEWCSDWYAGSYAGGNLVDPQGPALGLGLQRVIRGGSWKGLNRFCRSASRSASLIPGSNVGFRVVLAAPRP